MKYSMECAKLLIAKKNMKKKNNARLFKKEIINQHNNQND